MPLIGNKMPDYPRSGRNGRKSARKAEAPVPRTGELLTASGTKLLDTLGLVLVAGGAMMLGITRDGGSILVRCWLNGDQYEDWCAAPAELESTLEALRDAAEAAMLR